MRVSYSTWNREERCNSSFAVSAIMISASVVRVPVQASHCCCKVLLFDVVASMVQAAVVNRTSQTLFFVTQLSILRTGTAVVLLFVFVRVCAFVGVPS